METALVKELKESIFDLVCKEGYFLALDVRSKYAAEQLVKEGFLKRLSDMIVPLWVMHNPRSRNYFVLNDKSGETTAALLADKLRCVSRG